MGEGEKEAGGREGEIVLGTMYVFFSLVIATFISTNRLTDMRWTF
jgi:hypothetical protein